MTSNPITFASNTFVHFGCWNQGLCGVDETPLSKVISLS